MGLVSGREQKVETQRKRKLIRGFEASRQTGKGLRGHTETRSDEVKGR